MVFNFYYVAVNLIYVLQCLGAQNGVVAVGVHLALTQQQESVTEPKGQIQVVNDHDGGQAVVMAKLLHNLQHLILVVNVQTAGWFIQQQQPES